jgi:hypothetical protein
MLVPRLPPPDDLWIPEVTNVTGLFFFSNYYNPYE